MDRISGSGVFGRSPDAIVIITKHEQQDVYTVETTLRNHKSLEPFCVEWNYPLMMRNTSLDPKKLKKPGAFAQQFTPQQLLMALGNDEMTTAEWEAESCTLYKMSKRTFADKKKILVDEEKTVVKGDNCKLQRLQLHPLQHEPGAVFATAAAAVILNRCCSACTTSHLF
jgi:hypothetical protein